MPIVSISLNDEILSELDKLQSSMGFSGRSEAIRAGIRAFVSEEKQKADLSGNIHAILLVVHNDEFDHVVSGITHNFEDLITTHLHSKIEKEKCMELFLIDDCSLSSSERISSFNEIETIGICLMLLIIL